LSAADCEFEPRSDEAKENNIGIFCFFAKHSALRSKSKDWSTQNQDNVSRVERHVYQWIVSELAL